MYNSSEGIELTANISLASEVSAYTLDTIQKDDNGNFYYIVELTPGRPYIFSVTNNGSADLSSVYVYVHQYTETDGGKIGGSTQSASIAINGAAGAENWISYTAEEDGIYTFTVSNASGSGSIYLYQVKDSQLTYLKQQALSSGSTGEIANIILNKGDQIFLRIHQSSHEELNCNVQVSWEIWEITSVENDSNTKTITTNNSGEEGKVWLTFDSSIPEGKYTISTTDATLKLYKNGEEVASTPDNNTEAQGNTVTFPYQRNENDVYQLGITATGSSVTLAITKEPESETPGEGDNSDGNGDGSDNNGDNTGDSGNAGESEGSGDNTGDNTNNGSGDTNNSDNTSNGATTGDGNNTDN